MSKWKKVNRKKYLWRSDTHFVNVFKDNGLYRIHHGDYIKDTDFFETKIGHYVDSLKDGIKEAKKYMKSH